MSVQIMRLRGVPEDEADEVRELLAANNFDFYETPAGNWGISMPAIWLNDDSRLDEAKRLLDGYQVERQTQARQAYQQLKEAGRQRSILDTIIANPLRFFGYLLAAAVILYLSIKPFVEFGQ